MGNCGGNMKNFIIISMLSIYLGIITGVMQLSISNWEFWAILIPVNMVCWAIVAIKD
jgi:hypothetical protein